MWKKKLLTIFSVAVMMNIPVVFADETKVLDRSEIWETYGLKVADKNTKKMVYALYKSSKDVMKVCKPMELSFFMLVVDGWFPVAVRIDAHCKNKTYSPDNAVVAASKLTSAALAVIANKGGCAGISSVTISDPSEKNRKKYEVQIKMTCDVEIIKKYCKSDTANKWLCDSSIEDRKESIEKLKKYGITPSFKVTMRRAKED